MMWLFYLSKKIRWNVSANIVLASKSTNEAYRLKNCLGHTFFSPDLKTSQNRSEISFLRSFVFAKKFLRRKKTSQNDQNSKKKKKPCGAVDQMSDNCAPGGHVLAESDRGIRGLESLWLRCALRWACSRFSWCAPQERICIDVICNVVLRSWTSVCIL